MENLTTEADIHAAAAEEEAAAMRQRLQQRATSWWRPMMLLEWSVVAFMWVLVAIVRYGTSPRNRFDYCSSTQPVTDPGDPSNPLVSERNKGR